MFGCPRWNLPTSRCCVGTVLEPDLEGEFDALKRTFQQKRKPKKKKKHKHDGSH